LGALDLGPALLPTLSHTSTSVAASRAFTHALSKAKADGKHDVLMRIKSADAMRFVAMPVG
jgi:hypothetical protein